MARQSLIGEARFNAHLNDMLIAGAGRPHWQATGHEVEC